MSLRAALPLASQMLAGTGSAMGSQVLIEKEEMEKETKNTQTNGVQRREKGSRERVHCLENTV